MGEQSDIIYDIIVPKGMKHLWESEERRNWVKSKFADIGNYAIIQHNDKQLLVEILHESIVPKYKRKTFKIKNFKR